VLRRVQLVQLLEAPPQGLLLTLLSSFVFIMLAVLALELVGWFTFLGLLVTILTYLLLIIAFASGANINALGSARDIILHGASGVASMHAPRSSVHCSIVGDIGVYGLRVGL